MALVKFKNRAGQWVELVIDNLTTESAVQALSAKQGKVLQTNKADKATTLAGYGIADAYTKTEIDALISAVFRYKGVKATYAEVEAIQNPSVGDVWFVTADGSEYAWNGTAWEKLGPVIDLSHFLTSLSIAGITIDVNSTSITAAQLITALNVYTKSETYSKSEVDTIAGGKSNKVANPTTGHLVSLDSQGNLIDSTKSPSDFVAGNQGSANAGKALGIDNQGNVTPVPFSGEDFTGATEQTDGTHGYVPAPEAGDQDKFLKADGTWEEVPAAEEMEGATASTDGAGGSVPAPLAGDQIKFLKGDGTWEETPGAKLLTVQLDTVTNVSGSYSHVTNDDSVTADMQPVRIEVSTPSTFRDKITITTGAGTVTLSCADVVGTSTVKVFLLKQEDDPTAITSTEFDLLSNKIGNLTNLETTAKNNLVAAINELNTGLDELTDAQIHQIVSEVFEGEEE